MFLFYLGDGSGDGPDEGYRFGNTLEHFALHLLFMYFVFIAESYKVNFCMLFLVRENNAIRLPTLHKKHSRNPNLRELGKCFKSFHN